MKKKIIIAVATIFLLVLCLDIYQSTQPTTLNSRLHNLQITLPHLWHDATETLNDLADFELVNQKEESYITLIAENKSDIQTDFDTYERTILDKCLIMYNSPNLSTGIPFELENSTGNHYTFSTMIAETPLNFHVYVFENEDYYGYLTAWTGNDETTDLVSDLEALLISLH